LLWTTARSSFGGREHNLRNVNLDLPRNRLIVFTRVSGSGKSSLAFDTLYADGQRRYVESLSSYARQFLGQLQKPEVDLLAGLSPAIVILSEVLAESLLESSSGIRSFPVAVNPPPERNSHVRPSATS
jgi:excinuclease UvrABC ATPase subunit